MYKEMYRSEYAFAPVPGNGEPSCRVWQPGRGACEIRGGANVAAIPEHLRQIRKMGALWDYLWCKSGCRRVQRCKPGQPRRPGATPIDEATTERSPSPPAQHPHKHRHPPCLIVPRRWLYRPAEWGEGCPAFHLSSPCHSRRSGGFPGAHRRGRVVKRDDRGFPAGTGSLRPR